MARHLKPLKVSEFKRRKIGFDVTIYLDRNTTQFVAEFQGDRYEAATEQELRAKLEMGVKSLEELNWIPVILIEVYQEAKHRPEGSAKVVLDFCRLYIAQSPLGKVIQTDWDTEPEARLEASHEMDWKDGWGKEMTLPGINQYTHPWERETQAILPYSEEAWAGLQSINNALKSVGQLLVDLIGSKQALEQIAASRMSPLALLPGVESKEGGNDG